MRLISGRPITRVAGIRINGIGLAEDIKRSVRRAVAKLRQGGIDPCLATVLVGGDPASATYVKKKHESCAEVGITTVDRRLGEGTAQEDLNNAVDGLNGDARIHGILLQLPLPGHLDPAEAISRISPDKDVDGLTAYNAGRLAVGRPGLVPCTPLAIMYILDHCKIDLAGKTAVVISRSNLVGKPVHHLLLQRDATVITCHSKTRNLRDLCTLADVVVTAVGNRDVFELTPEMLRDGCAVIDVAITRHNGRLTGDTDYDKISAKAAHITPVPGGVGPMTVAMLLKNTVSAAAGQNGIEI